MNFLANKSQRLTVLFFALIIILTFFLYFSNLIAYFASDDFEWILVSQNRNPLTFFVTNSTGQVGTGNYGPLVNLVYYLSYKIGGLNPLPYHLFSLFFHLGNIILVYFLIKNFFSPKVTLLATLLFTVYFNNAEAVSWVAASPHLIAVFFYLLSVLLWLRFLDSKKIFFYLFSLVAFFLSFLAKEIAISLPLVILVLYFIKNRNKDLSPPLKKIISYWLVYLVFFILYLFLRRYISGVFLGYYGRTQFILDWQLYLDNFLSFIVALFSSGWLRIKLIQLVKDFTPVVLCLNLAVVIFLGFLFRKKIFYFLGGLLTFIFLAIPYLPLSLNPLNNEGERYLYLAAIVFLVFVSYLLVSFCQKKRLSGLILIFLIIFTSACILLEKNKIWQLGFEITQKIIEDFSQEVDLTKTGEGVVFLYLPDNLAGTQVFRNSIREAIKLYYPSYQLDAIVLPVYLVLQPDNWNQHLFNWQPGKKSYEILGQTVNNQRIITGFDRRESDDLIFELWGYDYQYFITDTIFIRIKENLASSMKNKKIHFLYFDEGKLKSLDSSLFSINN